MPVMQRAGRLGATPGSGYRPRVLIVRWTCTCPGGGAIQCSAIVFDARHPASIARFWAAALDDYEVAPYDDAELDRLHGLGIRDPEDDTTVLVEAGPGLPPLGFQSVPEARIVKNRVPWTWYPPTLTPRLSGSPDSEPAC